MANDQVKRIIEKCEQYWNEQGICDAEIHAALEFIAQEARLIEAACSQTVAPGLCTFKKDGEVCGRPLATSHYRHAFLHGDPVDMLNHEFQPPAVSTPRCPDCRASMLAMRNVFSTSKVSCNGVESHHFEMTRLADFAQFFQPASQPSPAHDAMTCSVLECKICYPAVARPSPEGESK